MSNKIEQTLHLAGQAAVLIAVSQICGKDHVLLTKRAEHLSSHSGEVAFPGGMWEPSDANLMETALRESHEEVGLHPARVKVNSELQATHTRRGVRVTPFVAEIDSPEGLVPCPDELESLFWVPMEFLLQDLRVRTDLFQMNGVTYWAPVYHFSGFEIWGFTARLLVDFLNTHHGQEISRANTAPEKIYPLV
ncbi:putative Nudix hydrolase NudL [Thalassocella blandensis]|nr:putative Nudix hydrolase NudL [Thalassocella blandensis]